MRRLAFVILVKIFLTVGWVTSLLLFPADWQKWLGLPPPGENAVFVQLLGMAYTALLVGYTFGFFAIVREKIYPRGVVWTGIVSNAGACLILAVSCSTWSAWRAYAPALMWASLLATGLITAGLIAFGPCNRLAIVASKIGCRK